MKTIFVVNPKAGQGINVESLIERIHTAASKINAITFLDCNNIIITPFDDSIKLCVDGEVLDAGKTEIKVIPNAFEFIIPSKKNFSIIKNITYVQKS